MLKDFIKRLCWASKETPKIEEEAHTHTISDSAYTALNKCEREIDELLWITLLDRVPRKNIELEDVEPFCRQIVESLKELIEESKCI